MSEEKKVDTEKKPYRKPVVKTEPLTAVAALCNGTTTASRKVSTGGVPACNAAKLKS